MNGARQADVDPTGRICEGVGADGARLAARLIEASLSVRTAADHTTATARLADALADLPGVAEVAVTATVTAPPAGWRAFAMMECGRQTGTVLLSIDAVSAFGPWEGSVITAIDAFMAARTDRRHLDAAVERADRLDLLLGAERQGRTQMLANLSHELRTPTNAILGFTEVMRRELFGSVGSERYRQYLSYMHGSAVRLSALIGDLLDLAMLQDGTFELHETVFDVSRLVAESIAMFELPIGEKNLQIDQQLSLDQIRADRRAIKQVLANLVGNSVKFTPMHGNIRVRADIDSGSGTIRLCVRDDGPGIAPETAERLFSPMQADPITSRPDVGPGLGLPLSQELVRQHGGRLNVLTGSEGGTTVCALLPASRLVANADAPDC